MTAQPGALVRYREREWVVMPSDNQEMIMLRPVGGSNRELCGVVRSLSDLIGASLPYERITEASFPLPTSDDVQDHAAVSLLLDAARLLLRDGAAPFRALGNLSVRPRGYQLVPLIMALRLETTRLLIADDVGIGKTVEAGLIARELLDRGEVRRVAVLCPPYLCEQWQKELAEKFHIHAEIVRGGTVARLERNKPPDKSIFQHYRHIVASIDTVKHDRYHDAFVQHAPDLMIVDEVHGAARPRGTSRNSSQQLRHRLVSNLSSDASRHMILLSATPHSGIEESFLSLLGLLKPEFEELNLDSLSKEERDELVRHLVQRRRKDVKIWEGENTPFPERDPEGAEQAYALSPDYMAFFDEVYDFASELVRSAETMTGLRKRMRFWSALALLRCVTSSPAAAEVALRRRVSTGGADAEEADLLDESTQTAEELDEEFSPLVQDPVETEVVIDTPPDAVFERQEQDPSLSANDRRKLRGFAQKAATLRGDKDAKLQKLIDIVDQLLEDGYHPIVWCRYIATAEYVGEELEKALARRYRQLKVTAITGAIADEERRLLVDQLGEAPVRVLVATDCLSEGINLQEHFSAVIHYDLPWNPNRLEQREGRVDRFGQQAETIKAIMLFGQDNPVDGAILEVLLRRARDIQRVLGISVPVPANSEKIMETVLASLFKGGRRTERMKQPTLFDLIEDEAEAEATNALVEQVHRDWTNAAERERVNRTRFAQRAIREADVMDALKETDRVLGSPAQVQAFVRTAAQRLPFSLEQAGMVRDGVTATRWRLAVGQLPNGVRYRLNGAQDQWDITFDSPTPAGLAYIGRNHGLVEGLAEHLLDQAFHPGNGPSPVARCGIIRTNQVKFRTTLFLLRLRYLQRVRGEESQTLAEETLAWGLRGIAPDLEPLTEDESQYLLDVAAPSANVEGWERTLILDETLAWWPDLQTQLDVLCQARAQALQEMHRDIRRTLQQRMLYVTPQTPPDLLGVLVLMPQIG